VDERTFDVALMQASHLLLGRPWQYDRRTIHDGFRNTYKLEHLGRKFLIPSLPPREVYKDQLALEKSFALFDITSKLQKKDEWSVVKKVSRVNEEKSGHERREHALSGVKM